MKDLTKLNGRGFAAMIDNVIVTGCISVEKYVFGADVYLCQDYKDGSYCFDRKGFMYSWVVNDGSPKCLIDNQVPFFTLTKDTYKKVPKKAYNWLEANFDNPDTVKQLVKLDLATFENIQSCYINGFLTRNTVKFSSTEDKVIYDPILFTTTHLGVLVNIAQTVICPRCGRREALDNITEAIDGEVSTIGLCGECAESLYYYNGEAYTKRGLNSFRLVALVDRTVVNPNITPVYQHRDGGYRLTPEKIYLRDYHSRCSEFYYFDTPIKTKFFIGYEVEKEDYTVLQSLFVTEFENTCTGWRKERDGSLDSDSGFEVISPIFPLSVPHIEKLIRENPVLVNHINADYGSHCGGHINISKENWTGEELFDTVKGYMPLLYALFPDRTTISYCMGKKASELKKDNSKYQAIRITYSYIELRIFSAVRNIDHLIWRTKLVEMMLNKPARTPEKAYLNIDLYFMDLFKEMYGSDFKVKFGLLKERFRDYTRQYEGKDLPLSIEVLGIKK